MSAHPRAAAIIDSLARRGEKLALAESLTGGALTSALVDVPGASRVVLGAVVAYATPVKASVLGVDEDLLAQRGAVDPEVARQMARGARARMLIGDSPAEFGLATTGVAGPDPQDGHPAGTVWVAISTAAGESAHGLLLEGDRSQIRAATVDAALQMLARELGIDSAE